MFRLSELNFLSYYIDPTDTAFHHIDASEHAQDSVAVCISRLPVVFRFVSDVCMSLVHRRKNLRMVSLSCLHRVSHVVCVVVSVLAHQKIYQPPVSRVLFALWNSLVEQQSLPISQQTSLQQYGFPCFHAVLIVYYLLLLFLQTCRQRSFFKHYLQVCCPLS